MFMEMLESVRVSKMIPITKTLGQLQFPGGSTLCNIRRILVRAYAREVDKWGERNVCHAIKVQRATKCEPSPTLAHPLVIRRGAKRPATSARGRRDRTRSSRRASSNVTNHCACLDTNKPQKAFRGLESEHRAR